MKPALFKCLVYTTFLSGVTVYSGHVAVALSGRSSSEIFDYLNRRLEGHNKLETVFNPIIDLLRIYTGDQDKKIRSQVYGKLLKERFKLRDLQFSTSPIIVYSSKGTVSFKSIAEAAKHAPSGATVEITAGDYDDAAAIWKQKEIFIKAIGGPVRLYAQGKSAEGKAIWVFRTDRATVEGISFFDAHVHDKNGAGIRAESGELLIRNCSFENNESGVLTTDSVRRLLVDNSIFKNNGHGDGYSHSIYSGQIKYLQVTNSEFHNAYVGHHIKSRAEKSVIENVKLYDQTGLVSYELNFPNGGDVEIVNSYLEQGRYHENSVMISFGEEGIKHPVNRMLLKNNTLNNKANGGSFIRTDAGTASVALQSNKFNGNAINLLFADEIRTTDNLYKDHIAFWKNSW